jgi:hypothetical protein
MLERSKAFFTRRDPQQGKLLPGYGLLYFDNLYGEYRSLPAERVIPEVKAIVDEILMKKQNASLAWNDLYTFDLLLARLQPPEKLPRKVWNLRSRYRDVAGLREYEAYLLKVYRLITFEKQFVWVFLKPCSFCQFFQRLASWPAWE